MWQPPEKALSSVLDDVVGHISDVRAILILLEKTLDSRYQPLREALGTDSAYSAVGSLRLALKLIDKTEQVVEFVSEEITETLTTKNEHN